MPWRHHFYIPVADPNNRRGLDNLDHYAEELAKATEPEEPGVIKNKRILDGYRASDEFLVYEALCRGEKVKVSPLNTETPGLGATNAILG